MTMFRPVRVALSLMVVMVSLTTTAAAQTNDEIFPTLEWNFSTPGARANGMGRSFIGLADDATAAITNPAGLVSLTRPQIYAEYKNTRLKVERLADINALTTLQPTAFTSVVNALSFLSFSAPVSNKIAVGFSVHRFLDYHEVFNLATRKIPNDPSNIFFFPVSGTADFTGTAFGGSVVGTVLADLSATGKLDYTVTLQGNSSATLLGASLTADVTDALTGNPIGNAVPDGGSTLTLLGCAMLGLGWLRKKLIA